MTVKGYLSGVALMLLSASVAATQLDIKNIDYGVDMYRLPWLTSSDNPKVAKRINDFIFSRFIRRLPGDDPQKALNQYSKSGSLDTGILDYTVKYRSDKTLTLDIILETCSAYCELQTIPLSFDLTNGAKISLNDLFAQKTIVELNTQVRKNIRAQIDTFLVQHPESKDESFYTTCATPDMENPEYPGYVKAFALQKDKLVFLNGRCSSHAELTSDGLGDFTTTIPIMALRNQLTPYGQYLFSTDNQRPILLPPNPDNKLMYGTLGKNMRIVLNVDCESKRFYGDYFYEKFGTPIELTGKCGSENNQHYELKTEDMVNPEEKITLDLKDGIYQGIWESNGKTLPVRFEDHASKGL